MFAEIMRYVSPGATMVGLGGYWSYYSMWILRESAGTRAVVVEPVSAHVEIGRMNARLNSCAPTFVQAFVGRYSVPSRPFRTELSGEI